MARMRNEERYEAQRTRILAESARIFRDRGYSQTSMEDLATALGVTKAAIYYYYKRKEEILFDICDQALEFAYETTIVTDSSMGAKERLERFVRGGVASIAENMAVFAVLFQETSLRKEARARRIVSRQRKFEIAVQDIFEDGIKEGTFRADLDPRLASLAVLGMCNWVYRWYNHEHYDVETIGEEFLKMIDYGAFSN